MKLIITNDEVWFKKWDEFVLSRGEGSFLELSIRMKSYEVYGVKCELMLWLDEYDSILMGSLNSITSFVLFKIYTCSYASSLIDCNQELFLNEFERRAIEIGAFVSQVSLPSDNIESIYVKGKIFNKIPFTERENRISLLDECGGALDAEDILSRFSKKARRDVRLSYRKGLSSKIAQNVLEYKLAYSCIENNAINKGYNVRAWEDFGLYLTNMIDSGTAFLITAWFNGEMQGAILLEKSANSLHYTMGGVFRRTPDLHTGYYLQMEAIKLAIELKCDYYDLSYGGPKEVMKFKNSFNPELINIGHIYHKVHNPLIFNCYNYVFNFVGKSPKLTKSVLSIVKWLKK